MRSCRCILSLLTDLVNTSMVRTERMDAEESRGIENIDQRESGTSAAEFVLDVSPKFRDRLLESAQGQFPRDGSAELMLLSMVNVAVQEGVATLSIDGSQVRRDGSSQAVQYMPSDVQLLYWTLVEDRVPDGFLSDFERLMTVVDAASDRQARASYVDNTQSALFLHELAKTKEVGHESKICR